MCQNFIGTASYIGLVRIIAGFGSAAVAGNTIGLRIILFALLPSWGVSNAAVTLVGQNLGAGKPERTEQAVHTAARFAMIAAVFFGIFFFFFPKQLLGIFGMNEPAVVAIGTQLLRVLSLSGLFIGVALTYTGGLQGTGDTKSPLYISLLSNLAIPLGICFFVRTFGTLQPLDIWLAILAGHATRCVLSVLRFNQGKWRGIAVDIGPPVSS